MGSGLIFVLQLPAALQSLLVDEALEILPAIVKGMALNNSTEELGRFFSFPVRSFISNFDKC